MSTRSLTVIKNKDGDEICVLYRQMDGYLEGHGQDLALFLKNKVITNGYGPNEPRDIANGMENLAVQLIAHLANAKVVDEKATTAKIFPGWSTFEQCVGQFYLYPANTRNYGEEYVYTIYEDWVKNPEGGVCLRTVDDATGEVLTDGAPIETINKVNEFLLAEKGAKV
jgi:hypothetical protein